MDIEKFDVLGKVTRNTHVALDLYFHRRVTARVKKRFISFLNRFPPIPCVLSPFNRSKINTGNGHLQSVNARETFLVPRSRGQM